MQTMGNLILPTTINYHLKLKTLSFSPSPDDDLPDYGNHFLDFHLQIFFMESRFDLDYLNSKDELLSETLGFDERLAYGNLDEESFETTQLRALQTLFPYMNEAEKEKYNQLLAQLEVGV